MSEISKRWICPNWERGPGFTSRLEVVNPGNSDGWLKVEYKGTSGGPEGTDNETITAGFRVGFEEQGGPTTRRVSGWLRITCQRRVAPNGYVTRPDGSVRQMIFYRE